MPLVKQIAEIPIVGGRDGGTEGPLKVKLDLLENGVYRKAGGVQKRYGTKKMVPCTTAQIGIVTTAPPVPDTLAAYRDECVRMGKGELSSYSKQINTANNGQRLYRDQVSEAYVLVDGVAASQYNLVRPDCAMGTNGVLIIVFGERSTSGALPALVYATCIDTTTGAVLMDRQLVESSSSYAHPRVVCVGNMACIFYGDTGANTNIFMRTINLASIATGVSARVTVLTTAYNSSLGKIFDICQDGTNVLLGYASTTAATRWKVAKVSTAGTVLSTATSAEVTNTASYEPTCCAICVDSINGRVWLARGYTQTTPAYATSISRFETSGMTEDVATVITYTSATSGEQPTAIGMLEVYADSRIALIVQTANTTLWVNYLSESTFASVLGARKVQIEQNARLISRPFLQDSKVFAYITTQAGVSGRGHMFLVDLGVHLTTSTTYDNMPLRVVANVAPRQVTVADTVEYATPLASSVNVSTNNWWTPLAGSWMASQSSSVALGKATFNAWHQTAEAGNLLAIAGGAPAFYDGCQAVEMGYYDTATITSVSVNAAAGSLSAGAYSYKLVREWVDARGNVHRSNASQTVTQTGFAASQSADVVIRHLGLTARQDAQTAYTNPVVHRLYRSLVNASTFYATKAQGYRDTRNVVTTTGAVTVTESAADTTISTYGQIYTTGGILEAQCPPSCTTLAVHRQRLWLGGTPTDALFYSKKFEYGVAPEFNDALTIEPFEGGRVVALASLDEVLVIFKESGIWILQGDGMNDTGDVDSSTLSEPRKVQTDVGCTEPRSVVSTPDGIMFLSQRGIYLLNRSLQVVFVGDPVSDLTGASGAGITSAVLVPAQNIVRFTRSLASSADYDTLVYDYEKGSWSVDKYYCTYSAAQRGALSACVVNGTYTWVTPEGQEYEEDTSTYLDGGTTWVTLKLRTAWIKTTGVLQGYQRCWYAMVLGERNTACGASVTLGYDYGAATQTAVTFAESATNTTPMQLSAGVATKPRNQAIQVTYQDSAPVTYGTGKGATIHGIALEYGVMTGKRNKGLPATQKG